MRLLPLIMILALLPACASFQFTHFERPDNIKITYQRNGSNAVLDVHSEGSVSAHDPLVGKLTGR